MEKEVKVGIVTGASSGLGMYMAELLCGQGHVVYAVARRKPHLEKLKQNCKELGGEIRIISGDLTDSKFRESIITKVLNESGRIDFLINNAGYGTLILLEKQELADIKKMYEINCTAYEHLTNLVIPVMKKQGGGRIICTCSIAGLNAPALFSTYGATKYAVYGYMKPLRYELKKYNISLGLVFPPRMQTDFWVTALNCYEMTPVQRKEVADKLTKGTADPKKIARRTVKNLETNKFMILPHWMSWMAYNMLRHMYWFYDWFMNKMMLGQVEKVLAPYKVKKGYSKSI